MLQQIIGLVMASVISTQYLWELFLVFDQSKDEKALKKQIIDILIMAYICLTAFKWVDVSMLTTIGGWWLTMYALICILVATVSLLARFILKLLTALKPLICKKKFMKGMQK